MEGMETAAAASPETSAQDTVSDATESNESQVAAGKAAPKAKAATEDLEEIKIGRESAKLPKNIAKIVKDLERGFHQKAQESATKEKQFEKQLEAAFKKNPEAFFEKYGLNVDDFAESRLAKRLEHLGMSEEQRELAKYRQQEAQRKEKEEEDSKRAESEKNEREEATLQQTFDAEVAEAWKSSGLPNDPHFIKQIGALMYDSRVLCAQGKYPEPLTASKAAAIVKDRFDSFLSSMLGKLEPDALYNRLGQETFNKLRKWDLERVTQKSAPTPNGDPKRSGAQPVSAKKSETKKPASEDEWEEYWKNLAQS